MGSEEGVKEGWDVCCPVPSLKTSVVAPLVNAAPAAEDASSYTTDAWSQPQHQWTDSRMDEQQPRSSPSGIAAAQGQRGSSAVQHQQERQQQQEQGFLPSRQPEKQQRRPRGGAEQRFFSVGSAQRQQLEEQQAVSKRGAAGVLRGLSSPVASEGSQWRRNMWIWMKGTIMYARCRPVLFFSFVFFSAAHVLLSVAFLRLFPCPLLLTWAQLSQSVFYAFVLGEAGDTFPVFRSLFPSTSRTLQRAYAAVAAAGGAAAGSAPAAWLLATGGGDEAPASAAEGAAAATFWQHRSGALLLLRLVLRLLPYSLGYCLLQYSNNVLAAHVLHPLQLPIVSSLALALHEILHFSFRRGGRNAAYVSRTSRYNNGGSSRPNDTPLERGLGGNAAARAHAASSTPPLENSRAVGGGGLPPAMVAAGRGKRGEGKEEGTTTGTGETELTAAMNPPASEASTAPLDCSAPSKDKQTADSSCWRLPCSIANSCFEFLYSRLMQLLSLLLLGVAPAVYICWYSASSFFCGAAGLFVLAFLMYRSWLLPKALHLPRSSGSGSSKSFSSAARQQQALGFSPFRSRAAAASERQPSLLSLPSYSFPSFNVGHSTSFRSFSAAAARASFFRPKEISLLQNLTGSVLLLLPGLFSGEQHYTTFPFRFLLSLRWDEWLAAGCWISIGTVAFLRKTTSASIMKEAGAPTWKAAELLALACVGCFGCVAFGNPGPAAAACCCVVVVGRVLGVAATPLSPHYHHHYGLLREQQQYQHRMLPSSEPAAATSVLGSAAHSSIEDRSTSVIDTAPQGNHGDGNSDAPQSAFADGSSRNEATTRNSSSAGGDSSSSSSGTGNGLHSSIVAAARGNSSTSSSSSSSSRPAGERGHWTLLQSFRSFGTRGLSRVHASRDDGPPLSFPSRASSTSSGSSEAWNTEAAAQAAAAAELPSVSLVEEPDVFWRPYHRGYPTGRRFFSGVASSASRISAASSLRGSAAATTWDRADAQALLAEDRSATHRAFPKMRSALAAIGEEEEDEEKVLAAPPQGAESLSVAAAPGGEGAAIPPKAAAAGGEEEEEPQEEVAAAAMRGFLMDVVRAYVSRTSVEDLLLLEQWGGTSGVAAAVGADLVQGLPDERRRNGTGSSSSSEDDDESTAGDEEVEAEKHSAAMLVACTPPILSSAAAAAPSVVEPPLAATAAASSSATPVGLPPAAAAAEEWPGGYRPPQLQPRRPVYKRLQQQKLPAGAERARGGRGGREEEVGGEEELDEGGAAAEKEENEEVVLEQRRLYGVNRLPRRPLSSFFSLCMEAASDATLKVLMFCGLTSLVLALLFSKEPETEMIEGLAIWVAVLVVVLVTAGNDWMKEQQFSLLSAVKEDKKCSVIRSGEAKQLSVFDLVVGDLLQLEAGDEIPADALFVQGRDVKVDESSLTGESDPIAKDAFLVCMREATAMQRQQQQQQRRERLLPEKKQAQRGHPQEQQQQEGGEEGESVAASTLAESVPLAVGSPSQAALLREEVHSSTPPCYSLSSSSSSSARRSSVGARFASEASAAASSAGLCRPESAGRGDGVLACLSSPGDSSSLAAAASVPFAFFSSSSSVGAAPPPLSPESSLALVARHHAVPSPVLLSGTTLSTGSCTALVIAVGRYSQVGQTFQKLAFDPEPTPLQMKLNALAEDIGNFGLAAAIVAFFVLVLEFWVLFWLLPPQVRLEMRAVDILHEHVEFFVTAITILVVAVPEGLPLAVTISLAYSIGQMLRDQNYVRRLAACEIMGGANEICSDKTGTLTKNQMAVTVFWTGDHPGTSLKEGKTPPLLLEIPPQAATATAAGAAEGREQEWATAERGEAAVIPTGGLGAAEGAWDGAPAQTSGKEGTENMGGRVSARGERRSGVEERTATGFSEEYTRPLLEAEHTARTTARSTEAGEAATGRTAAAGAATGARDKSIRSDKSRKYAAWIEGEGKRQHQLKWLLLAEAIAANSTAFLEQEEGQDPAAAGADGWPVAGQQTTRTTDETEETTSPPGGIRYRHVGSPTECALLAFTMFQGHRDYACLRRQFLGEEDCYLLDRREFTSDKKMMTSVIRLGPEAVRLEHDLLEQQQQRTQQLPSQQHQQSVQQGGEQQKPLKRAKVGDVRVFVKGAAERVLRQCSRVLVNDSEEYVLTPALVSMIEEKVINCMAGRALRTICIAYKDVPKEDASSDRPPQHQHRQEQEEQRETTTAAFSSGLPTTASSVTPTAADVSPTSSPAGFAHAGDTAGGAPGTVADLDAFERDLVCLGIAGIEDPVREEVPGAVLQCQEAGIRVRMVTGDNLLTAVAIATQCNIYHEAAGGLAMLGSDFMRYVGGVVCQRCGTAVCNCATDTRTAAEEGRPLRVDVIKNIEAFQAIWQRLEVLARSQPTDKYALVCALQQLHRVVAVTGDGTNDAPALRKADVGFAMGLTGKEVAKQAADIVMLDDNFTCIVKAVRWGRSVYDNIRRFLQFQLTVNVVAVLLTVTCVAVEREAPLSAVQMLWINLIMDSFASLALATEPPTDALLRRKPHGRDSYLISKIMLASILTAACYQIIVILVLIFYGEKLLPETPWTFVAQQERLKLQFCEFSDGVPEHCVGSHMVSGRRYKVFSTEEDYKTEWLRELGPSRHKTFVFNTFVFMQIFNMIAARDVDDESPSSSLLQLGAAMLRNKLGLSVWLFILLAQILMTELGGRVLGCHFDVSRDKEDTQLL